MSTASSISGCVGDATRRCLAGGAVVLLVGLALLLAPVEPLAAADVASDSSQSLVLVAGASGQTGRLVLQRAKAAGLRVRAMARDPAAAARDAAGDYQWVGGDVRDPGTLASAMVGVTFVVCAIGATERSGPNSPEFVDFGGVRNLTDAARAAGVRHFVLVSSAGVGGGGGAFGWLLNTVVMPGILEWKAKGEQHLRASGLAYTILRPGALSNDPGDRIGVRFAQGDKLGGGTIARADVAAVALYSLGNGDAAYKTFELVSDESARPGAWRQALTALKRD